LQPVEIDRKCEQIIREFMELECGGFVVPIPTSALTRLIERDADDLDLYADLSKDGQGIDGVTDFVKDKRPRVRISKELSEAKNEHRLRTTLTHEYGHVKFHAPLVAAEALDQDLFGPGATKTPHHCNRERIYSKNTSNWMEWQAGYVCGSLLMPLTIFKEFVLEFFKRENTHAPLKICTPLAEKLLAEISQKFHVSRDAAKVRLFYVGNGSYLTDGDPHPTML
jgi:hypothetical protein